MGLMIKLIGAYINSKSTTKEMIISMFLIILMRMSRLKCCKPCSIIHSLPKTINIGCLAISNGSMTKVKASLKTIKKRAVRQDCLPISISTFWKSCAISFILIGFIIMVMVMSILTSFIKIPN